MTQESTLLFAQQTKRSLSAKSYAMLTYLSFGYWFLKCPTSLQFQHVTLEQYQVFDWLLLLFLLPLSLIFFLPLMTYNDSLDNFPELLLLKSSPRTRSRIFSKVNPSDPAELVTTVIVPDQLSGKDNSSSKAWTSSSNLMLTNISLAKIEFVLLMYSVTELANPQFAFSTNWNLYHRIFNSEPPIFCHLKWLNKILGTTNFKSWQSFFFCTTQNHSPTDLVAVPTALALRTTTVAGHRCCEVDLGASSLHRCETLSLGTLL